MSDRIQTIRDTLRDFGDLYSLEDLLDEIRAGRMQSFSDGDNWAVTQVCEFPRRVVLSIEFVIGTAENMAPLEAKIEAFAQSLGITAIIADGRLGFDHIKTNGWKRVSSRYVKELGNGSQSTQ